MTFGKRYEHNDEKFKGLLKAISDNLRNSNVVGILSFFPFLKHIPGDPGNYKLVIQNDFKVKEHIRRIVDDRRKTFDSTEVTNYLDAFLKHQTENPRPDSTFTGILFLFPHFTKTGQNSY